MAVSNGCIKILSLLIAKGVKVRIFPDSWRYPERFDALLHARNQDIEELLVSYFKLTIPADPSMSPGASFERREEVLQFDVANTPDRITSPDPMLRLSQLLNRSIPPIPSSQNSSK